MLNLAVVQLVSSCFPLPEATAPVTGPHSIAIVLIRLLEQLASLLLCVSLLGLPYIVMCHRTSGFKNRNAFLTLLEARSLR